MELIPLSTEQADVVRWRDGAGSWHATVVCKATYALQPGTLELAERQLPIVTEPQHHEDGSLWAPSDLAPRKRRCDVVLVGHAHAPRGHVTPQLSVSLRLAGIDKTLLVVGARLLDERGVQLPPAAFRRMPLRHHLAPSGRGNENPVGVPEGGTVAHDGIRSLPNLSWPHGQDGGVACFAPIAPAWPTRQVLVGAAGLRWLALPARDAPMPADLDLDYFQCAPRDQQIHFPRCEEPLALSHLHPDHPQLLCHLPASRVVAYAKARGRDPEEVAMVCDTIWINTDEQIVSLTWRGVLALRGAPETYRVLTLLAAAGEDPGYEKMHRRAAGRDEMELSTDREELGDTQRRREVGAITETELSKDLVPGPALPFQSRDSSPPSPRDSPPPPRRDSPPPPRRDSPPALLHDSPLPPLHDSAPPSARGSGPPPPQLPRQSSASVWSGNRMDEPVRPAVTSQQQGEGPAGGGVLAAMDAARTSSAGVAPEGRASQVGRRDDRRALLPRQRHKLLWFDPDRSEAVRAVPELAELLSDRDLRLIEQGRDDELEGVAKDRGDLFEVLARAEPTRVASLHSRVDAATDEHGMFEPPVVVVAGELSFPFDPIQRLRATVTVLTPLSLGDKQLRPLIEEAEELLQAPWLEVSHEVVDQLVTRLEREAGKAKRAPSAETLDGKTEKLLLEQRAYQQRKLYGSTWIRALLAERGQPPVVCYLPASLRDALPLYARFAARLLVELDLREDQGEASPLALRALALSRTLPL